MSGAILFHAGVRRNTTNSLENRERGKYCGAILRSSLLGTGFVAGFLSGLETDFETTQAMAAGCRCP
jgi:hypothetical protein